MSEPSAQQDVHGMEPVQERAGTESVGPWTSRLVFFLRLMAGVSMVKGLFHWSEVCGIGAGPDQLFELHSIAWQSATVFFAVLDLVAAIGLWLAAAWGAVIWLTSVASMVTLEIFFPQVFGGGELTAILEGGLLVVYLFLALKSANEQPV
ncbi:MAG: DUF6163 family protein [Pseudolabrys sp.]